MEAYNLPIKLRTWWIKRLIKQFEDEKQQIKKSQQ
tara:strand:- start:126 stop:230 length:105 start_codon:yes stop_codon:yes gene_type:complete